MQFSPFNRNGRESLNIKKCLKIGGSFLLLLAVTACFSVPVARAQNASFPNLTYIKNKVAFLGYARQHMPELYADFVLRYDAAEFLDALQEAANHIGFSMGPIQATNFDVYAPSLQEFDAGEVQLSEFKNDLKKFIENYPSRNSSLLVSIATELQTASLMDGLNGGLIQSKFLPNSVEILRLPPEQRLAELEKNLRSKPQITGFSPRLMGLNQNFISGDQFLQFYNSAAAAQYNITRLLWLSVLNKRRGQASVSVVQDLTPLISNLNEQDFLAAFGPESFQKNDADLITELTQKIPALNFRKLQKAAKESYAILKAGAMPHWAAGENRVLSLTRVHPYAAGFRGCLGDCSSTNAAPLPLAKNEFIYWIRRSDGKIKGYLQFTRVNAEGTPSLYVNTISGTEITRTDVRLALAALNSQLGEFGAKKILIPVPEKFKAIINYPEVAFVFRELAQTARRVPVEYLDAQDRLELAPFLLDNLDQPSTNEFAVEIQPEKIKDLRISSTRVTLDSRDLFPDLSKEEALIIALDLRNRETENHHLSEILKIYGISPEAFQRLWDVMSNQQKDPVEIFHRKVRQITSEFNFSMNWETFQHSPLLFRGHFAAPDALTGSHFDLAFEYLKTYLTTLSELDYVYTNVGSHVTDLVAKPEFIQLIHLLFKRNIKEMHRLLDAYELEYRSAYRTLVRLFEAGLPLAPFENEIQQLNIPLEDDQEDPQVKDSVFVRRKTLLGMIDNNPLRHFNDLMAYLESMASSRRAMDGDDMRAVSHYFSAASNSKWISPAQINRINQFILGSEFGLSFTPSLGMFKNNRLDVPRFVDALFDAHKYLWAAYLIHKNPWPKHPKASVWLKIMWQNRGEIGIPTMIDGIVANPSWLEVKGVDEVVNGLLAVARDTITDENLMAHILIKNPKILTAPQLKWLSEMSTPGLAKMVLTATYGPEWPQASATYLQKKLNDPRRIIGKPAPTVLDQEKIVRQDLRIFNKTVNSVVAESSGKTGLQPPSKIPYIKTINVITGVPQQADVGANTSGGFGDVAANVVAALEVKRLHPDVKVRLLVTSVAKRYDPVVATTDEIVKIMIPELDPAKKGVVQNYHGVQVIFLDCDFGDLLKKTTQVAMITTKRKIINRLSQLIPAADLNLNFSNFPDSEALLRINATLSVGVEENYGSGDLVDEVLPEGRGTVEGAYAALRSGPTSAGFMMIHETSDSAANIRLIQSWAATSGIKIPTGPFKPVMAYASEWQAAQVYVYALAHRPPAGPTVLFIKHFPELDISMLPPNVKVAFIKGMPHEVMSAIIQESFYSPLVTGDISLGQALSSARPGKTLVYEAPPWKVESAARLRWLLASNLGLKPSDLADLFLLAERMEKMNKEDLKTMGTRLGNILADKDLQKGLYDVIQKMSSRWDSIDNTLRLANGVLNRKQNRNQNDDNENDAVTKVAKILTTRLYGAVKNPCVPQIEKVAN